jgi:hypothetical protein
MKSKTATTQLKVILALTIGILGAMAFIWNRKGNHEASTQAASPPPSTAVAVPGTAAPPLAVQPAAPEVQPPLKTLAATLVTTENVKTQAVVAVKKPSKKKVVQDPLARDALGLVGIDPDAEQYWLAALTDANLPKSERQDLVDDLNEQGLPDPKHPTPEDLPVLLARLSMIEELAAENIGPDLELKEPYDDLVNLVEVALGGGKPVN